MSWVEKVFNGEVIFNGDFIIQFNFICGCSNVDFASLKNLTDTTVEIDRVLILAFKIESEAFV